MDEPIVLFEPASWSCNCPNSDPCPSCRAKDLAALGRLSERELVMVLERQQATREFIQTVFGAPTYVSREQALVLARQPRFVLHHNALLAAAALAGDGYDDTVAVFEPQRTNGRCENCAGKRSAEANYCPRCGHRRKP